ncbi:MAG TPA: metalloregulator ArsR/SmtB family transcription factor [Chitinispirillaceae bacterium]|nr:metalloregulator ArsR/SmtB family transcription factor [Chitinispirillaceae bacterium]
MDKIINIVKALSDSNRIRTLFALRKSELCVCRIIELLDLAPSTVSKHIAVLKHAGLVKSRKEEKWIYYRLSDTADLDEKVLTILEWVFNSLSQDEKIIEDSNSLVKILKQSPEILCRNRIGKKAKKLRGD